ncbi:phospholipase/carboxylesterase [Actinoalloteichus hoggarensis]|uniref:Putative hydrolase MhqD n=1 Tax=Actinoalloteichus hoggarensis TaxID=1470176 RepID=A0A221W3I2_9PSEU|nr:alpha/beta hydrolase [Actinoalloteichus hoggarensis]ASO20375.1 Putative hydrolase MhqD [Actinoalloteichus hoggarensis]MBB5923413.1 phospholipase/carboxylesterase [Actinoalloteichus hoggarensis]
MSERDRPLRHRFHPGDEDSPVLLLLHGTGGGPDDLVGLARELSPTAPLIAPAGPVSEHGAARWFRRLAEGVFDDADVVARAHQLADFVDDARHRHGLADRRLIALGFSNGANIAAAVVLLRPASLREAVLFSAMMPLPDAPEESLTGSRVLLSNGKRDPMAPLPAADRLVAALAENSAQVTTHRHPGGHEITVTGLQAARDWLGDGDWPDRD